jgi:hypothetical protein
MSDLLKNRDIIIELKPVGSLMRVSVMDTESLIEIIISGPVNAPEHVLKTNALKRLEYVLKQKRIV